MCLTRLSLLLVLWLRLPADAIHREDTAVGADADVDVVGQPQKAATAADAADPRAAMSDLEKAVDEAVSSSIAAPGCLLDAEGAVVLCASPAPGLLWRCCFAVSPAFRSYLVACVPFLLSCCSLRCCSGCSE